VAGRDVSRPDHLPNRRPDGQPPDPSWLPRQRRGITPQMIGRYPDFDVFAAEASWDEKTTAVVKGRMSPAGPLRFFTPEEEATLRAFCDTATAQDRDPRIPVANMIDAKLADGRLDGYRYEDMPEDPQTWRLVLRGLDEAARGRGADDFAGLDADAREEVVGAFAGGGVTGGTWEGLNVTRAWSVCMRAILTAFYSHPWAWNEIGFGGPAYPRGFMRLGQGASVLEPFERAGATAEDPVRVVGEEAS
jgi:gluconate 2-dehydrogenase subunit 3-like protein